MERNRVTEIDASDPFGARLGLGIVEMAHHVLIPSSHAEFDIKYEPIINAMLACRRAKENIIDSVSEHKKKLSQNIIVSHKTDHFEVLESIDAPVRESLTSFITNGMLAVKGIQDALGMFGVDIGYLFQKMDKFDAGMNALYASGQHFLASYLKLTRNLWSEKFIARADELEHHGWIMPEFTYKRLDADKIELVAPMIDELAVTDYPIILLNHVLGLVENVLAYGIKRKLGGRETIVEIPTSERDPSRPVRFKIVPPSEAVMEWDIRYTDEGFYG